MDYAKVVNAFEKAMFNWRLMDADASLGEL